AAQEEARAAESPGLERLLRPLAAASAPASLACAVAFAVAAGLAAAADSSGLDPFGAGVLTLLPVLAGAWTLNRRCVIGAGAVRDRRGDDGRHRRGGRDGLRRAHRSGRRGPAAHGDRGRRGRPGGRVRRLPGLARPRT